MALEEEEEEEEDYLFFGTRLVEEDEVKGQQRKAAAAESAALTRKAPLWKEEVFDEQGRRRFHGAFTGGFSAGYHNSVGSKEGWVPTSFVSSRHKRAERREQSAVDYMDEDEREERKAQSLNAAQEFDTFGSTAAEFARRQAASEARRRPGVIPGPIPDEIVLPAAGGIGMELLRKMGWRHGRTVGPDGEVDATKFLEVAEKVMKMGRKDHPRMMEDLHGTRQICERSLGSTQTSVGVGDYRSRQECDDNPLEDAREKKRSNTTTSKFAMDRYEQQGFGDRGAGDAVAGVVQEERRKRGVGMEAPVGAAKGGVMEEVALDDGGDNDGMVSCRRSPRVLALVPKDDLFGLGFDCFKDAPDFRKARKARLANEREFGGAGLALSRSHHLGVPVPTTGLMGSGRKGASLLGTSGWRQGEGFGIGALEEPGIEDEDVYGQSGEYDFEIGGEEEDVREEEQHPIRGGSRGQNWNPLSRREGSQSKQLPQPFRASRKVISGFRLGGTVGGGPDVINGYPPPPSIPPDFQSIHRFPDGKLALPGGSGDDGASAAAPPEVVEPPADETVKKAVDTFAPLVAKIGQQLEDLARQKMTGKRTFGFLFGREGSKYYMRRLWEEREKVRESARRAKAAAMDSNRRAQILGEQPLKCEPASSKKPKKVAFMPSEQLKAVLPIAFSRGEEQDMNADSACKPFASDPVKQSKYEQFLRDRSAEKIGVAEMKATDDLKPSAPSFSVMAADDGPRVPDTSAQEEVKEFERVAQLLRHLPIPQAMDKPGVQIDGGYGTEKSEISDTRKSRFTSGGVEFPLGMPLQQQLMVLAARPAKLTPWREESVWRPAHLLCKRFNLLDPYPGNPCHHPPSRPKSRMDVLSGFEKLGASGEDVPRRPCGVPPVEDPQDAVEAAPIGSTPPIASREPHAVDSPPPPKHDDEELERRGKGVHGEREGEIPLPDDPDKFVERPFDLFKAIFSDEESDDEGMSADAHPSFSSHAGMATGSQGEEKSSVSIGAAQAAAFALNRLVAKDFLSSLGDEMGLKVPDPKPPPQRHYYVKPSPPGGMNTGRQAMSGKSGDAELRGQKPGRLKVESYSQTHEQEGPIPTKETVDCDRRGEDCGDVRIARDKEAGERETCQGKAKVGYEVDGMVVVGKMSPSSRFAEGEEDELATFKTVTGWEASSARTDAQVPRGSAREMECDTPLGVDQRLDKNRRLDGGHGGEEEKKRKASRESRQRRKEQGSATESSEGSDRSGWEERRRKKRHRREINKRGKKERRGDRSLRTREGERERRKQQRATSPSEEKGRRKKKSEEEKNRKKKRRRRRRKHRRSDDDGKRRKNVTRDDRKRRKQHKQRGRPSSPSSSASSSSSYSSSSDAESSTDSSDD
ncbi:hypothetical protein CBR_g57132 [Chara braunii]|uniref:G-patch domain-containing protein n=1 Tax=Chara braunii TaxID=69332 RepID=A0A388ME72_CHABU|nr:hypothetical protein CBR_g57132 [Chara braunii]|eukprot:GBG92782.1 hypothetical protein CBR_g57132 [Chara braunii]